MRFSPASPAVLTPINLVVELPDRACQSRLGVQFKALSVEVNLPPLLQDGRTGLIAGGLLQATSQVPGRGLHDGGLHYSAIWQTFRRCAWRADDGFEVVELFGDAIIALRADGSFRSGQGEGQRS